MNRNKKQFFGIKEVQIHLASPEQIRKQSVVIIDKPVTISSEGLPIPYGLSDSRMGAITKTESCRTCNRFFNDCKGHFGSIELEKPVFNIFFIKQIQKICNEFCYLCGAEYKAKNCKNCEIKAPSIEISQIGVFTKDNTLWELEEVREFLEKVSSKDLEKMNIFKPPVRPEWTIMHVIPVPPLKTRPTIFLESGGRSEDDLTYKLIDIVRTNLKIKSLKEQEILTPIVEISMLLRYHFTTYLDNTLPKVPVSKHRNQRPLRCLSSRISGKEGRIRHNLGGKRTNHSARAIIVPDLTLEPNEVGIPSSVTKRLTKKVLITEQNKSEIQKELLSEDTIVKYIFCQDGTSYRVTPDLKKKLLDFIVPGNVIKRTLKNGDYCLFNRQPSLHRHSIQGHKIRVTEGKENVFSINPLVCYPYNADFDGDEMNLHIVQDIDAEKEIENKLDVIKNAVAEKSGLPVLGLTKDYISGLYLLSTYQDKIPLSLFYPYLTEDKNTTEEKTGSEILRLCLPNDFRYNSDSVVVNQTSVLGKITKKEVKPENNLLGYSLLKTYGSVVYSKILVLLGRVACVFEDYVGVTVPVSFFNLKKEVEVAKEITELKKKLLSEMEGLSNEAVEEKCDEFRLALNKKYEQILQENKIDNIMVSSGSSGASINIGQLYAAVGQQNIHSGKTIENPLLSEKVYPFFNESSVIARGLITSSYKEGLSEVEYFNHCIAGRESIVDSHIKTSQSGYFQRRLINSLADVHTNKNGFITDSEGKVYQSPDVRFFDYIKTSFEKVERGIDEIVKNNPGNEDCKVYSFYPSNLKDKLKPLKVSSQGKVLINKLIKNSIVPNNTPVGILCSQSIGEPATQLTLKSFHHSGVGELDVVSGIEKVIVITSLQFKQKLDQRGVITFLLDKQRLSELLLVNLSENYHLEYDDENLTVILKTIKDNDTSSYFEGLSRILSRSLCSIKKSEEGVILKAISKSKYSKLLEILQNKIEKKFYEKRSSDDQLLLKGFTIDLLKKVLLEDYSKVTYETTDILDIEKNLGIEEARRRIILVLNSVFEQQGAIISYKYLSLIADAMSREGVLKPISRSGIISTKESFLARAAFESTVPIFVTSSSLAKTDKLRGVIERILINKEISLFTDE